jgi:quercetin dioxygenase-like cupin family protein
MEILNLREAPKVPFNLDGHILCSHNNIQVLHLNLKPGEKIDQHINEFDVIFHVLEGKALLITDSNKVLVHKDDCIKIEAGMNRGFDNISVGNFKVMVIKILQSKK